MKIEKQELLEALKKSSKGSHSLYKEMCVLQYQNSKLSIQVVGSDYCKEIEIQNFKIEKEENFRIAINAVVLSKVINSIKKEKKKFQGNFNFLEFAVKENNLSLITDKGNYDVLATNDYPEFFEEAFDTFTSCPQDIFSNSIKKIISSASKESIKPVFTGIYFTKNVIVASDSKRLSLAYLSNEIDVSGVVPLATIQEIQKNLNTGELQYSFNSSHACFIINNIKIITRLVDGNFPDYEKVIPEKFSIESSFNRKELVDDLERVKLFTCKPTNKIKIQIQKDEIEVSAKTPEIGKCSETITCKTSKFKEQLAIGANITFILDAIKSIDTNRVYLKFTGETSPFIAQSENKDTLTVIMPIKIKSE